MLLGDMECKLCSRWFSNGKALGGHMRSHYATLPLPPKTPPQKDHQLTDDESPPPTESTASSLDNDRSETIGGGEGDCGGCYGLRENPRKSVKVKDPKFLDADSSASPTESTRGRSNNYKPNKGRTLKVEEEEEDEVARKVMPEKPISEMGEEEYVALCLIMLSRDVWKKDSSMELVKKKMMGQAYECDVCGKGFKSSQGLGSHRNSHFKKIKKKPFNMVDDFTVIAKGDYQEEQEASSTG